MLLTKRCPRDTRELWNFARARLEELGKVEKGRVEGKVGVVMEELETRHQVRAGAPRLGHWF